MTLRDWFAGQALAGVLTDPDMRVANASAAHVATTAYALADAMIAARNINTDEETPP
jgi:hypothetical protein